MVQHTKAYDLYKPGHYMAPITPPKNLTFIKNNLQFHLSK